MDLSIHPIHRRCPALIQDRRSGLRGGCIEISSGWSMGSWTSGGCPGPLCLCVCYVHAVCLRCGPCIYATRDPIHHVASHTTHVVVCSTGCTRHLPTRHHADLWIYESSWLMAHETSWATGCTRCLWPHHEYEYSRLCTMVYLS